MRRTEQLQGQRLMKFEDVYGRCYRGELSQVGASAIMGFSGRTLRRWRTRWAAVPKEGRLFRGQFAGGGRDMTEPNRSPRITQLSWGRLEVEGERTFKDAKLFPGGAREWDWRETGTHHVPGIQPADLEELLAHGSTAVVLSKGILERLQVCPETLALLEERGIPAHVLQTEQAVGRYNELRQTERVAGLFHSTC